jgi:vancomycin resistance protein VanW
VGARLAIHRARRLLSWAARPSAFSRPALARVGEHPHLLYEHRVALARDDAAAHPLLEEGKRTNVALAAPRFDGLHVAPGAPLSFWRALGRATAARGFRDGMELRGGCIVPALGGGLCLLSNALFEMAAVLGWSILQRHGHSMQALPPAPGTMWGLDATVAWPHVDLRIAPRRGSARVGMRVAGDHLVLTVHADAPRSLACILHPTDDRVHRDARGLTRSNVIVRSIHEVATGALVEHDVIARNRKRLLTEQQQARSCLTCGVARCASRPAGTSAAAR